MEEKISTIPRHLRQKFEDNLKWANYTFPESKFENGSNLAINIKKSSLKLTLVNNIKKEEKNLKPKLEKIFLIPYDTWDGQMGQMINITKFGKFKFDENRPITIIFFLFKRKVMKNKYLDSNDISLTNGIGSHNDWYSCPLILIGTVILFGGSGEGKQISILYPFGWKRINSLKFKFDEGRCHLKDDTIFLCFGSREQNKCRSR